MSIRVVIADDEALVRTGFRMILKTEPGIEVVGEAADGAQAADEALLRKPDVVLMDIRMPNVDGLEGTRRISSRTNGRVRVLVVTTFDLDDYVYEALRAGASGFLLKDTPPEQLVSAVRTVAEGDALLAPSVTRRLIAEFARTPHARPRPDELADLTPRELEVLRLVARGLSNAEIADDLVLSAKTVKTHVQRILMKLGLRDRVQAVVLAYECGLAQPGSAG